MTGYVERHWDRCAPWLQAALDHDDNLFTLADVRARCEDGRALLWPLRHGALVLETALFPTAAVLRVWLAGGDPAAGPGQALAEIAAQRPHLERLAAERGCRFVEIAGRAGWERVFGLRRVASLMRMEVR